MLRLVLRFLNNFQFLLLALILILGWLYMLYGMIYGKLNVAVWIIFFSLSIVLKLFALFRFGHLKKGDA
ncbi:hypothetical protein [Lunatimonas salinarum]|uniref:hypothetical protein n=1 Tax=Lunatimonas salinarum TaxID=1774590 RepID=UPI001ADF7366|nr:hypothetical protein [Lunatimonas salinarum]